MGWTGHDCLPHCLYRCWILRGYVWCGWWYSQGATNACHGSASQGKLLTFVVVTCFHLGVRTKLTLNLLPLQVSSASSACMILFTSFTATTSFVVFGLLDMEYALICLMLGFVATLVGQIGLFYLMQKYQRNSYIAFSIGGIVLLSAFLMTIQSLLSMADSGGPKPPTGLCTGKQ